jgi:hypothetical protein
MIDYLDTLTALPADGAIADRRFAGTRSGVNAIP